jgi:hypothetical protein
VPEEKAVDAAPAVAPVRNAIVETDDEVLE